MEKYLDLGCCVIAAQTPDVKEREDGACGDGGDRSRRKSVEDNVVIFARVFISEIESTKLAFQLSLNQLRTLNY